MRKAVVNVGGYVLNALAIEHFILRLPCRPKNVRTSPWKHFQRAEANPAMAFFKSVGMEEIREHSAYGFDWNEPMVTFAPVLREPILPCSKTCFAPAKVRYLQMTCPTSRGKTRKKRASTLILSY